MYVQGNGDLGSWIRNEVDFDETIENGARGRKVERVQEWLNLHGVGLVVDGDFGPITARQVDAFQQRNSLTRTGKVDRETFDTLTAPMHAVLAPQTKAGEDFSACMTRLAELHLSVHPMEIGGQNRGPWVRMYMQGNQGGAWPWCAGFTTFLMKQAAELLDRSTPIKGSFSCDSLVAQAREKGLFVSESGASTAELPDGSLFLVRRTSTDWTHVGTVKDSAGDSFATIEGNTNDEGAREGYEVCERRRGYSSKDFIVF